MCCFYRLHLLSRIPPWGKHGEGTNPGPQVEFPWEMQAGVSVHVIKRKALGVCSVPLLWEVARSTQILTAEMALVSKAVKRLGWLSPLKRAVETTSRPPSASTGHKSQLFLIKIQVRLNFLFISALESSKY